MLDGVDDLYHKSGAAAFGISPARFEEILEKIAARHAPHSSPRDRRKFWDCLRLTEIALAWGCACGNEAAWERFVEVYRGKLETMALSLTHDLSSARELAGSMYGDLFACRLLSKSPGDPRFVSRFEGYSGRGSLEGWLRAVMAQEYANRLRSQKPLVSFEAQLASGTQFAASPVDEAADPRLLLAIDTALAELAAPDRFLLASYFLDGRTLAAISKSLGTHESTVSRRLDRAKREVRSSTVKVLRSMGIGPRQVEEMLLDSAGNFEIDLRARLAGAQQ